MAFQYLTNVSLPQAREEYLQLLIQNGLQSHTEQISVWESCGRITSEAVYAHICAPHYHASAMDGIAVLASTTFGATETTPVHLTPDQYIVVDTGDPLPENCDAVIMVEDIVKEENGNVRIYNAATPWQHIRQIGEDICAGEMILPSYTTISPSAIGALLAGGILEIKVIKKPVIGIIPTGDEIIPPTTDPAPGDIIEFNSSIFSAMVRQWGAEAVTFPIVPDNFDAMKKAVANALETCDIVLLNAGSSAGREDYSEGVIRELGGVLYHGIAMKPGKPAILGYQKEKAILGVPGYPVSGIIVIEQLLKPIIEYINHTHAKTDAYVDAVLSRAVVSGLKYQEFVRVRMGYVDGKLILERSGDFYTIGSAGIEKEEHLSTDFIDAQKLLNVGARNYYDSWFADKADLTVSSKGDIQVRDSVRMTNYTNATMTAGGGIIFAGVLIFNFGDKLRIKKPDL